MKRSLGTILCLAVLACAHHARADATIQLRLGAEYTRYSEDYGDGNGQFASVLLGEGRYSLRVDAGHAERFGDEGVGIGGALTAFLRDGWRVGVGASTGTGDVIFPDYRLDASIGRAFLAGDNLILTLSYTHEQSKAENHYDRVGAGIQWWAGEHWILAGFFNNDIGHPGDTTTRSGGVGLTWYRWLERYAGVEVRYGDITYTQVGPTSFLVDYQETAVRATFTEYFSRRSGVEVRGDVATNDFYDLYGIAVTFFREW